MGTVVSAAASFEQSRLRALTLENQRIEHLICANAKLKDSDDVGILLNLLDEYGSAMLVSIIRSKYDPQFAL